MIDGSRVNDGCGVKEEQGTAERKELRQPGAAEESVFIDLLRTTDALMRGVADVLKKGKLSPTQYNVLRILRGSDQGLTCGEIAGRLITRDPDITRLLDRLEKRGLISRSRETRDRRIVLTRITSAGLALLARLDGPVLKAHWNQLGHLGPKNLRKLSELLRQARKGGE
jgi:DNA-binding MarR family transcriptional regulator